MTLKLLDTPEEPVRAVLRRALYGGKSPGEYAESVFTEYGDEYAQMRYVAESDPASTEPFSASLDWIYDEAVTAAQYPGLIVLSRWQESYTGGAHGLAENEYVVIDTVTAERLILDAFLVQDARPRLRLKIEEALRRWADLPAGTPLSSGGLFEDSVEIPENFFVCPDGLGFQWNAYDIAPYVYGLIEIVIPWEETAGLLNARGQALTKEL
jgi:hypothetical protein